MMKTSIARGVSVMAIAVSYFGFFAGSASAQILRVFMVNTTSDTVVANACATGAAGCSLRGAITASNPNGDALIQFNIPTTDPFCSAGVCTINLSSVLPTLIGPNTHIVGPGAAQLVVRPATGVLVRMFVVDHSGGTISISGLTLRDGRAQTGGAIDKIGDGVLDVNELVISNNSAVFGGGGIRVVNGTLNLRRSLVTLNTAPQGSGGGLLVVNDGIGNVINTTFYQNNSGQGGGGISSERTLNVTNSTIANNSSPGDGGGILRLAGTIAIKSSIVAQNSGLNAAPDISGSIVSAGFNLVGRREGSAGITAPTDMTGTIAAPLSAGLNPLSLNNYGGPVSTLCPGRNSTALDKGSASGLTGVLTTDQRGTGFTRKRDHPLLTNATGGDGTDIGACERHISTTFDFEDDGRTDIGIFRPNGGEWWIYRSAFANTRAFQFGSSTDRIAPADFTGDGRTDIAFWRPGTGEWYVLRSEDFSFFAFGFGSNGDVPAPADFDGDRTADAAVFRPSSGTWFILKSTGPLAIEQFGTNGDVPVAADYDGDGRADVAIYRPSNGQWWLNRSTAGVVAFTFGSSTDKVAPADYTGDNKIDVAFWRPSNGNWFILRSEDSSFFGFAFGTLGDVPAPGDYDGDGKADPTVFRPSIGTWFSQRSLGGFAIQQFGINGDRPVANAFIP